jgi:cytidine deaminase
MNNNELLEQAKNAKENSYSPYSNFKVGAALLDINDNVYLGTNIENASIGATICAERVAFTTAIASGVTEFKSIAVVGGLSTAGPSTGEPGVGPSVCPPCGICRQFIREFVDPTTFRIILQQSVIPNSSHSVIAKEQSDCGNLSDSNNIVEYTLEQLLPLSFGPSNLKEK